jgi:hypothetical protein
MMAIEPPKASIYGFSKRRVPADQATLGGNLDESIGWNCVFRFLDEVLCRFLSISGGPRMVLKNVGMAILGTMLLGWSSASLADEYRPDEFLRLDLSKALLSPKPLGPASRFAPVAVEAKSDHRSEGAQARAEPQAESRIVKTKRIVIPSTRVAHMHAVKPRVHAEKPRGAARTTLARRHGDPLDAQAFDTRIQVWPCKSGGICDWKR